MSVYAAPGGYGDPVPEHVQQFVVYLYRHIRQEHQRAESFSEPAMLLYDRLATLVHVQPEPAGKRLLRC